MYLLPWKVLELKDYINDFVNFPFLCWPKRQSTHLWLSPSKMEASTRTESLLLEGLKSCMPAAVETLPTSPSVAPSQRAFVSTFPLLFVMAHLLCVWKTFRISQNVLVNFFQNLHFGRRLRISFQSACVSSTKTPNVMPLFRPMFYSL